MLKKINKRETTLLQAKGSKMVQTMRWSDLPLDLLANVFCYLSPDSLAIASSVCRQWNTCVKAYTSYNTVHCRCPPWFLAISTRRPSLSCYAHNPVADKWHHLPLHRSAPVPALVRPIASVGIGGLILFRHTATTVLRLSLCNPFTAQFHPLPPLHFSRTNPAVGATVPSHPSSPLSFRIYVAGGMTVAPSGAAAAYHPTVEMYDSRCDTWKIMGSMPAEFAVRLTVWTPGGGVYCNGVLYWITSARTYSVMGFEIGGAAWRELRVPMADRLEFAALVQRNGKLTLIGGGCGGSGGGDAWIWELSAGEDCGWRVIEKLPEELGKRFLGGKHSWDGTKCVGSDGVVWIYRELGSGMVAWREDSDGWQWLWIEGCCCDQQQRQEEEEEEEARTESNNIIIPIQGLLLHPNLSSGRREGAGRISDQRCDAHVNDN
ncbi:F-box/kelch-repeat protein At3g24760-like [Diospyros lotus]|uniref:F-box/kelch-repeat protein At3g24760-like n=1 Tax=Diospyros lotus TaxID=55363 RepID=UPI0022575C0C|nr:F-box/kelch-repeat protein At3g24760-like [Diospyros lotus]